MTATFTALPYFLAIASDLRRCGYHRRDLLGLYAFNLLLLPVNLAGVGQSIVQGIGGQKIAFARTPKVRNRTVSPLSYVVMPLVVILWSLNVMSIDWVEQQWMHLFFATLNAVLMAYAIVRYVGLPQLVADIGVNLWSLAHTRPKSRTTADTNADWVTVLYHGNPLDGESDLVAPRAGALAAEDRTTARPTRHRHRGRRQVAVDRRDPLSRPTRPEHNRRAGDHRLAPTVRSNRDEADHG